MSSEKKNKKKAPQKNLVEKLIWIMSQVERIPKNGYNNFHKYHYALESDVKDACRQFMAEAGVLMTFSVLDTEQRRDDIVRVHSEVTFHCANTGETLTFEISGDGQDKNDKGIYKAITGSTKYALMSTFLIPTGDDPEKDSVQNVGTSGKKPTKRTTTEGYRAGDGKKKPFPNPAEDPQLVTPKQKKAVEAIVAKQFGDRDKFKTWAASLGGIGQKDGKLSMNLLTRKFASRLIDNTGLAITLYTKWHDEVFGAVDNEWEDRVNEHMSRVPATFVSDTLVALGYDNVYEIDDDAHQDEFIARCEAEYVRITKELNLDEGGNEDE